MKPFKSSLFSFPQFVRAAMAVAALIAGYASAQTIAYDDAANYVVSSNWTNGANLGSGFTPWAITTSGPDNHGTYIVSGNNPTFVIATVTNVLGTNYNDIFGIYANGTNDINKTTAFRGFTNPLGTNTFKLQWGSRGAGSTTTFNNGLVHGYCGFTLRNGNATNSPDDFQTGVLFYLYFLDGAAPSTLYIWDNNGVQSVPGTSFSDLGRGNITNAVQAELTPSPDGVTYHLVLKDSVQGRTLFATNGTFIGNSPTTVDSAALFCKETSGDQIYNRMQIAVPHIAPTIANLQPADGSLYLAPGATDISFEVDSFNSTVVSSAVNIYLNGVLLNGSTFSTASPTSQLLVTNNTTLAPDLFYTYTVVAQDANGNVVSNNYTFNTFLATDLYIDAYDYNYTNGLFVNSSTPTHAYQNLLGTNTVDYSISDTTGANNTAGYRTGDFPQILSLNTDATGDPIDHANEVATYGSIFNLGFTDAGNWENFTRVIPVATNYSIYARAASSGGGQFEIEKLVNPTATTTTQPLAALGRVSVPVTGGSKIYSGQLTPLTDFFGNTVVIPLSGTTTIRQTAISSQGYNLEYLLVVAVTNATSTLRPYIAIGSPAVNASAVALNTPVSFTIANRQTSVITNTIQMFLNNTNVSSRLSMTSNIVGTAVNWTPTNNWPANVTNSVVVIFTDSTGTSLTNSWNFITGSTGGALGSGLWSGAGGADMNWSTAANWTNGTPGPGFSASFASLGATTSPVTNNIVSANITILQLNYETNNSGYHTTWIQDGVTLTVTNPSTATGVQFVQVGGPGNGGDNVFNKLVTNTITGNGGTLFVTGNDPRIPGNPANNSNFQIRQCASPAVPNAVTLDMSGLGTLIANVGKFYVAQGGAGIYQSNVSGCLYMARTNIVTCLRPNAGQFEVGDSSGGIYTLAGSTLNLGITNTFFVDTVRFGKSKATNNLIRFNPAFTNIAVPTTYMRNTNGAATRVSTWTIGDADTETTVPNFVQANVDLSGGKLDALVGTMIIGRGETTATDSGYAQGRLTLTAGTLDVNNLTNGIQRANNTATESGIVNINGTATLVSPNIVLAQAAPGATASLVTGTLNVTNGTVRGNIAAGGGVSTVNLNGGTLVVSNNVGTVAAPVSALNLVNASLHLKADGNATTTNINAAAVSASGTTTVTIDSVANVAGPHTIHLIGYTGSDPYSSLSLAPLPSGYTGNLVDNPGSIDLSITVSTPPPSPTIRNITISSSQVILGGTNNNGAGGTYSVWSSTNLTVPLINWTLINSGSFDANGNFSSTNLTGTNSARFYILRVP